MNISETREAGQLMIDYADGKVKEVQRQSLSGGLWIVWTNDPNWCWEKFTYRATPEPLECWALVHDKGRIFSLHFTKELAIEKQLELIVMPLRIVHLVESKPCNKS